VVHSRDDMTPLRRLEPIIMRDDRTGPDRVDSIG
jgi:hypothetical protein